MQLTHSILVILCLFFIPIHANDAKFVTPAWVEHWRDARCALDSRDFDSAKLKYTMLISEMGGVKEGYRMISIFYRELANAYYSQGDKETAINLLCDAIRFSNSFVYVGDVEVYEKTRQDRQLEERFGGDTQKALDSVTDRIPNSRKSLYFGQIGSSTVVIEEHQELAKEFNDEHQCEPCNSKKP